MFSQTTPIKKSLSYPRKADRNSLSGSLALPVESPNLSLMALRPVIYRGSPLKENHLLNWPLRQKIRNRVLYGRRILRD
jgi:hypothetical protein